MKKLLALLLAAAMALSLTACGGKNYDADFTGKLDITSFDMTIEDILWLEIVQGYNAEYDAEATVEYFRTEFEAGMGHELSLDELGLLLGMYGKEYELDDRGESRTILKFSNGDIYGISKEDGKLDFIKWSYVGPTSKSAISVWEAVITGVMDAWTAEYGEAEVDKTERFYTWYGNVNGEHASLCIEKGNGTTTASMLELDRVK